jgi:hypothetical protein
MPLGNVYSETLLEIWEGENLRDLRTRILSQRSLPEACQACLSKYDGGRRVKGG